MPVDGVEVARAREAMATFQPGSGRETLAPLGAAALENRAAGAGRHPRPESVPALPASNVRLEGAFQESCEKKMAGCGRPCRPPASIEKPAAGRWLGRATRHLRMAATDVREVSGRAAERSMSQNLQMRKSTGESRMAHRPRTTFPQLWRLLWKGKKLPAQRPVFRASSRMFSSVEGPRWRCYDRRFPESGGGSSNPACNALLN